MARGQGKKQRQTFASRHRVPFPGAAAALCLGAAVALLGQPGLLVEASAQARPALASLPLEITQGSVEFVNGDKLSGRVGALGGGKLWFHQELSDQAAEFPLENVSQLTFAGPPIPPTERCDAVYTQDGSYFAANVTALSDHTVEAVTAAGQEISIPDERITGIGFYRPNDVLLHSDFSSEAVMRLTPVLGSWSVEKGQLVQASPLAFCRVYARVVQAGAVRYEWAMDLSGSAIGGICFYAARWDTRFGDSAYMVTLRGRQAHFYKIIGEARHEGKRARITSSGSLVHFRIEYDPRTGEILLWTDGTIIMRLHDPRPLLQGRYVLLHTEGRAVFDDLRITHLVGRTDGVAATPSLDTVFLSNGDRVSGDIVAISEQVFLRNPYMTSDTAIPRNHVRSVAFALPRKDLPPGDGAAPSRVSFWNGDVIYGGVTAMDDQTATLETSFFPELVVARSNIRDITFSSDDRIAPNPEETTYPLLTIDADEGEAFGDIEDQMTENDDEEQTAEEQQVPADDETGGGEEKQEARTQE